MTETATRTHKKLAIAGATILPVALALTYWAFGRTSPALPDDPAELLRRAAASSTTVEPRPTGKVVTTDGTSDSGAPVQVRRIEVQAKDGPKGYVFQPHEPLKEGETATVKLPGGGSLVFSRPKDGEPIRRPGDTKKPSAP